jgi:hypothetical protein
VLLVTEAGDVAESEPFRLLEHPGLPSFRKDVLKQLHRDRQIEYELNERTVRLLPPAVTAAEGPESTSCAGSG